MTRAFTLAIWARRRLLRKCANTNVPELGIELQQNGTVFPPGTSLTIDESSLPTLKSRAGKTARYRSYCRKAILKTFAVTVDYQ
ncbi:hypothetical protein KCP75_15455 [Salmonella enterica subsp. enterica]|nr:hypothetical protein KCP75_15455 [Salmonella enterica subsp. enterica]